MWLRKLEGQFAETNEVMQKLMEGQAALLAKVSR